MKVKNLLSKHFDVYYLPCENCGYRTGKCTEESNKRCWKCGKVIHRDISYKTLKPEIKKLISEKEYNSFHSASNKFMREFKALLKKHSASIVRSAGEGNKLVISVETETMFEETEFDEDITIESFTHEWFKRLNYYSLTAPSARTELRSMSDKKQKTNNPATFGDVDARIRAMAQEKVAASLTIPKKKK